uniref:Insulin-like growth factor-binding protein 2 n=1 Tax=Monodelphis domestica TaxID=13616 RepID=A0A5F8GP41_MONDO
SSGGCHLPPPRPCCHNCQHAAEAEWPRAAAAATSAAFAAGLGREPRGPSRGAVPLSPLHPRAPGRLRSPFRRASCASSGAPSCCPVCARLEGEACGVYTPRCAQGLRCYPHPGSELPLQALVQGEGTCVKLRDTEYGTSQEQVADTIDDSDGGLAENHVDGTVSVLGGGVRKPHKSGMKELAVIREKVIGQHRQLGKVNMHHHIHEDTKKLRPPPTRTPCQQELDQVLERISTMRLPDERGPLEHLYSLHIPNCDKQGLYNLKQCKMSLNGQRGGHMLSECSSLEPTSALMPPSPRPSSPNISRERREWPGGWECWWW